MWLLSTDRAELHYFQTPQDVPGGYVVLSHVWQTQEQTFHDIQQLRGPPRKLAARVRPSSKIHHCCAVAQSHGFKWVWIDTCCIDKTSSTELSEAINSMYEWYAQAAVCYAYLHDVPRGLSAALSQPGSPFRRSKWFTRGWTLQELIAPRCVIFLARDWTMLGTKASWASLLEEITGVDAEILTFQQEVADVSIARRMSWASRRETTRVEDQAYALMGIFDVHMPTIYGEGTNAFRRLQEEIMKQSSDQSLFAWGDIASVDGHCPFDSKAWKPDVDDPDSYILAPSPAAFAQSGNIVPVSLRSTVDTAMAVLQHACADTSGEKTANGVSNSQNFSLKVPEFSLTSHGVRMRVLVAGLPGGSDLTVALLPCQDTPDGSFIGLLLLPSPEHAESDLPQYHVAISKPTSEDTRMPWLYYQPYRLLRIRPNAGFLFRDQCHTLSWRDVYVAHRHYPRRPRIDPGGTVVVHFPRWLVKELRDLGFSPNRADVENGWDEEVVASWSKLWTRGAKRGPVVFSNPISKEAFQIYLDQCKDALWVNVDISTPTPKRDACAFAPASGRHREPGACETATAIATGTFDPECVKHHVDHWPLQSRTFGDADRRVRLSLSRWPHVARVAYLADIRLEGRVFQVAQRPSSGSGNGPRHFPIGRHACRPFLRSTLASVWQRRRSLCRLGLFPRLFL